jgi:hypothetical protein
LPARSSLPLVGPSSESERIQSRTLVSDIGFTPPPLVPYPALIIVSLFTAISPAGTRIQLRHHFAFWCYSIPGVRGRPLLGPSPTLIVVFVSMPPLCFFSRKVLRISIRKEERGNIWDGGGSSQCRRGLANPGRFVGWCAGAQWLPSLMLFFKWHLIASLQN